MKIKSSIALIAIILLAASCAPTQEKAAGTAPAAAVVAPADIKDVATWISTYDSLIAQHSDVAAKINAGDPSGMNKSTELIKTASEMDAVAETIKASLSGKDLTDFTAKAQEYKDKFAASATN